VNFAVGLLLGRWNGAAPGRVLRLDPPDSRVIADVREALVNRLGESAAAGIDTCIGGIGRFLACDFFPWHARLYRRRPPYWALASAGQTYLLAHDSATPGALREILGTLGASLPEGWERRVDGGIAPALTPLRALLPDPALRARAR